MLSFLTAIRLEIPDCYEIDISFMEPPRPDYYLIRVTLRCRLAGSRFYSVARSISATADREDERELVQLLKADADYQRQKGD